MKRSKADFTSNHGDDGYIAVTFPGLEALQETDGAPCPVAAEEAARKAAADHEKTARNEELLRQALAARVRLEIWILMPLQRLRRVVQVEALQRSTLKGVYRCLAALLEVDLTQVTLFELVPKTMIVRDESRVSVPVSLCPSQLFCCIAPRSVSCVPRRVAVYPAVLLPSGALGLAHIPLVVPFASNGRLGDLKSTVGEMLFPSQRGRQWCAEQLWAVVEHDERGLHAVREAADTDIHRARETGCLAHIAVIFESMHIRSTVRFYPQSVAMDEAEALIGTVKRVYVEGPLVKLDVLCSHTSSLFVSLCPLDVEPMS